MTLSDLLILALFTWYVSYAITRTHGPLRLFERARLWLKPLGVLDCIVCTAVWVSLLGYVLLASPYAALVSIGAAAGAALWGHKYTGWDYHG